MTKLRKFATDESGVTSIEYAVLAGGVALAIAAIVGSLGPLLRIPLMNIIAAMGG